MTILRRGNDVRAAHRVEPAEGAQTKSVEGFVSTRIPTFHVTNYNALSRTIVLIIGYLIGDPGAVEPPLCHGHTDPRRRRAGGIGDA